MKEVDEAMDAEEVKVVDVAKEEEMSRMHIMNILKEVAEEEEEEVIMGKATRRRLTNPKLNAIPVVNMDTIHRNVTQKKMTKRQILQTVRRIQQSLPCSFHYRMKLVEVTACGTSIMELATI